MALETYQQVPYICDREACGHVIHMDAEAPQEADSSTPPGRGVLPTLARATAVMLVVGIIILNGVVFNTMDAWPTSYESELGTAVSSDERGMLLVLFGGNGLLVFLLVLNLVAIWRLSGGKGAPSRACPECRQSHMIPVDSPRGQFLARLHALDESGDGT